MSRKLQIKRGAKADLPVLAQGEFGMATDSNAEELHLGTGSKNIHVPTVGVYYDDMNALVRSGIFRVGANTNLPDTLWYGQVLVMQGADSDTIAQIGMGYTSAQIVARAGQKANGVWTFTEWAEQGAGGDFVSKAGDSMTGELSIRNRSDYVGLSKVRDINSTAYIYDFAVGNDTTRGASGSLRFTNDAGTVLGRLDMWADGSITHKVGSSAYLGLGRVVTGSYTGTGVYGSSKKNSLTFDFAPKFVIICPASSSEYLAFPYVWGADWVGVVSASYHNITPASVSGNTMSWYNAGNAGCQLNSSGNTYYYIAIG